MHFISTDGAAKPAGHYSQAVVHQGLVYVAGQVPKYPLGRTECPGSFEDQARLVLENIAKILEAANSGIEHVLKVTVYLVDINMWQKMDEIYGSFFGCHRPARTTVPVPALRHPYQVEIDVIAAVRS